MNVWQNKGIWLAGFIFFHFLILDYLFLYSFQQVNHLKETYVSPVSEMLSKPIGKINLNESDLGIGKILEESLDERFLLSLHSALFYLVSSMDRISLMSPSGEMLRLSLDVSTNFEFSTIWRRTLTFPIPKDLHWIVDIGAMDGLSGSNSYNFIAQGWNALLVEPLPRHVARAQRNLETFLSRTDQTVIIEHAAVTNYDGKIDLNIFNENSKTSNTILSQHHRTKKLPSETISVPAMTAKSLLTKYAIPKSFGVLTIDAEGVDTIILASILELEYRPKFVIIEISDGQERKDIPLLEPRNYAVLAHLGSNYIWEYQGKI